MAIPQYSTPTFTIKAKAQNLTTAGDIYVTFSNQYRTKKFTIKNPTATFDGTDTVLTVDLTQEQTGMFRVNEWVYVQINWTPNGKRFPTKIGKFQVTENLLKEIIGDGD